MHNSIFEDIHSRNGIMVEARVMVIDKLSRLASMTAISALLILILVSTAAAFSYTVETLNNTITKDESAFFKVTIKNPLNQQDYFTISTRDVNWILNTNPSSGLIASQSEMEFLLELKPKQNTVEGRTYFVPIKINSENTGFYIEEREEFGILVLSPGDRNPSVYVPTVTPTISTDKIIDPREKMSVTVRLTNRNSRELNDVKVSIDGEVFQKEYFTTLLPLEDKINEILFDVNPRLVPGKRTMTLYLWFENKTIAQSSSEYEILGYDLMSETSSSESILFRFKKEYTIRNDGNKAGIAEHKFRTNFFEGLFTSFNPESVKERGSDGKTYHVIRKELKPDETLEITAVTDYRLLMSIILAIIIGTVLYFLLRSPIILFKTAEPMGKTSAEGLSEVKVRLYLKNRSGKQVSNIRVIDIIPSIADIKKSTHVGSMDPVNVSKGKKGTIARWEFDRLEAYEERIIAYKIESKLKLVGGIRLPNGKVRFPGAKGRERIAYSNNVNLIHKHQEEKA